LKPTKTQKTLTGRRIVQVEHKPKELILYLDDGTEFSAKAYAGGYEVDGYGLDFKFEGDKVKCQ
jgi:hypothetical protein